MSALLPRLSKLPIVPVARERLLHAVIHFEKLNGQPAHRYVLSLKNICTRRLLLQLGDDPDFYRTHLPSPLIRYVTYDYLTKTNNAEFVTDSKFLFCRDCSLNELGATKCRRRKCLANRLRQALHEVSSRIIPSEKGQRFAVLETDETEEEQPVVFIQLASTNYRSHSLNQRHPNENAHQWIEEHFYLLDLMRVLHINIASE